MIEKQLIEATLTEVLGQLKNLQPLAPTVQVETWTVPISSVAAFAAYRLAQLVNDGQCFSKEASETILNSNCIKVLTEHLSSRDKSIRDGAIIALSSLCNLESVVLSSQWGSDPLLKALTVLLSDSSEDRRTAAACIVHSYYRKNLAARTKVIEFDKGRLLKKLVQMVNSFERLSLLNLHLCHLRDLIYFDGSIAHNLAAKLREAGLGEHIDKLMTELEPQADTRIRLTELGFTRFVVASLTQLKQDLET